VTSKNKGEKKIISFMVWTVHEGATREGLFTWSAGEKERLAQRKGETKYFTKSSLPTPIRSWKEKSFGREKGK